MKIIKSWGFGIAALALLIGAGQAQAGAYDAWGYRMKIRIADYSQPETLTNFPILVVLNTNNIPGFLYSNFNSPTNGADLRFAASNETSELNYEIEKWDTTGSSYVWVKLPTLASTNDYIYAYWGKAAVTAPACTTNGSTWNTADLAVYHFSETNGAALARDFTDNGRDATINGTTPAQGITGEAQSFPADASKYVSGPATLVGYGISGSFTLSMWIKTHLNDWQCLVTDGNSYNDAYGYLFVGTSGQIAHGLDAGGVWHNKDDVNAGITLDQWHMVVQRYNGSSMEVYYDGILKDTYSASGTVKTGSRTLCLGQRGGDYPLDGEMDEVRISSEALSTNWIYTCWLNQASNSQFLAFSDIGPQSTSLAVRADPATGIGATSAEMGGTVLLTGGAENPDVYLCWGYTDGGTTSTSGWEHAETLGTNWGTGQSFSTNITGLISGSNYSYRCFATNSTGYDWSDSAISFSTIQLPAITNLGATSIGRQTATLRGEITGTGGEIPSAWFLYWQNGSATTTTVAKGTQSGVFSSDITGLQEANNYSYRCVASNAAGVATSENQTFQTLANPYDAWGYRMKIRIADYNRPETLTNFPTLVVLSTNISGFLYSDFNSSSNGADLRFSTSDGETELNYELAQWNTNDSSYVWVQIPTISSTNDYIYAYWGSAAGIATCTTNGSTWTNGFQGVWHLDETSGNALDSTPNHYSGAVTVSARGVAGKVASGYQFDGSGNFVNINMTLGTTATISTWASQAAGAEMLWVVHGDSPGPDLWFPDGSIYLNTWDGFNNRFCSEPANVEQLHHYVTVIDSVRNLSELYIDGLLAATASYKNPSGSPFYISKNGADYDWVGVIDEFSISSVARSSNWVYACWLNQASNSTFLAFSDAGRVSTNLSVRANPVSGIGITSATMSGTILNIGGAENPNVYLCWGYTDGGTASTSGWDHVEFLGANWGVGQTVATNITDLLLGSNYTYRCYATNSTGEDWSDAVSFRTVYLPTVTNLGATAVGGYSATLNGEITDFGNEAPFVWYHYWPAGGSTTIVDTAIQNGVFNAPLPGLQNGITYTYQWCASNAAGVVFSETQDFTTAAQTRTWVGATSDWFTDNNWSPSGIPQAEDTVIIPSAAASPLITHSPAPLTALTITSGTLTCSNWSTVISATDITIQNSGKITLPGAFSGSGMSNRVYIACSNLTVDAGGQIDASERGYAVGSGPGKGTGTDLVGGAGHGGRGGYAQGRGNIPNEVGGPVYGSETEPNEPGSSTTVGWAGNQSGKGGGVIRIEASGTVTINGTLNANAGNATESHAGGGSGGSIYINCQTFQGSTSGQIIAKGGDAGLYGDSWNGGGGGGGRIAVIYQTCNLPSVNFSVIPGFSYFTDGGNTYGAEMGTLYLSTTEALTPLLSTLSGRLLVPGGLSSWSPASLIISNCAIGFGTNFQLNVGGDLMVTGATAQLRMGANSTLASSGSLQMNGGKILLETNATVTCNAGTLNGSVFVVKGNFTCATDLTLTNGALFYVYSGPTNNSTDYGSLVRIDHKLSVAPSSWVYPYSEPVSGASPLFQMPYLTIASNGGFNAIGTGYGIGQGPGSRSQGDRGTGASHGGKGGMGDQRDIPGPAYGSSNAPIEAGSGANISYQGGNKGLGGGVIRLEVANLLSLSGTLDASGGTHLGGSQHGGGGAGGSIFVIAGRFDSAVGSVLNAKGGTAGVIDNSQNGGGGGGGGRIAVWVGYSPNSVTRYVTTGLGSRPEIFETFLGTTSTTNGLGYYNGPPDGAESGTVQLLWSPGQGTVFTIR